MLRVWSDRQSAGVLDRHKDRGATFVYDQKAAEVRAVSATMPVRTASWNVSFGLLPIFDMNLPEGALRAHLTRRFSKATGRFDDLDLLGVVGRTQIGRLRYSGTDESLSEDVPFQSVDDILRARRGGELLDDLIETFAIHSGLSGIQPKVMIRAASDRPSHDRQSLMFRGATHIVKLWEPTEYPELAANEFFCLSAAKAMGFDVPKFQLSDDGRALVVNRFDLKPDGSYLGYEDFCVLNGVSAAEKYRGGYEMRLFGRARQFIDVDQQPEALESLFALLVLNCAIRNGDAHLKNFGIAYEDVSGPSRLAPVYDLVSTQPYLPKDAMALTLNGSTNWPDRKQLTVLGQTRSDMSLQAVNRVFERTADALADVAKDVASYFKTTAAHREIGTKMLASWNAGVRDSLGIGRSTG